MKTNDLLEVGKWLDEDKDYRVGTQEEYDAFVKRRNYKIPFDGGVLGFDRARSSDVDSGVGDDPKSSKTYKRQ